MESLSSLAPFKNSHVRGISFSYDENLNLTPQSLPVHEDENFPYGERSSALRLIIKEIPANQMLSSVDLKGVRLASDREIELVKNGEGFAFK